MPPATMTNSTIETSSSTSVKPRRPVMSVTPHHRREREGARATPDRIGGIHLHVSGRAGAGEIPRERARTVGGGPPAGEVGIGAAPPAAIHRAVRPQFVQLLRRHLVRDRDD